MWKVKEELESSQLTVDMTETPEGMEEDIAKDVLENICNMNGVEKNIQVWYSLTQFEIHSQKGVNIHEHIAFIGFQIHYFPLMVL